MIDLSDLSAGPGRRAVQSALIWICGPDCSPEFFGVSLTRPSVMHSEFYERQTISVTEIRFWKFSTPDKPHCEDFRIF